jgi:predicted secreted protein
MLNYNKIYSDMNRNNIRLTILARHGKIKYTSFKDRFLKEKLYASEVEMIAEYFGRPISYYFDQETTGLIKYPEEENLNMDREPNAKRLFSKETYQRKIEDLTKKLSDITKELNKVNKRFQQ